MGGGSTQSQSSQVQFKDPWAPAVPALNTALSGALNAYNTTYNGPNVASMDPNVTAGQDQILANSANGLVSGGAQDALSSLRGILSNGGLSALQQQGATGVQSGQSTLSGVADNLNPIASGKYLDPASNPYFAKALQDSLDQTANGVNAQFSSAGRYGSGAHTDTLTRDLGKIATGAYSDQYNKNMADMLSANSQLQGVASGQGGLGSTLAGIGQQGVSNIQNSGSALSALGTAQNTDAANQMGVGGQRMDYAQQQIDAANQSPWVKVGNLAQIASGIGGLGGTSWGASQSTQQQSGGAGGVLGGILSGLGGLGNLAGGLGKLAGAGGFAALFSDERLKENIERVGKTDDGQNIYAYNYKADPLKRRTMGLLAQEVEKRKPEAVMRDPESGYRMVNYGMALEGA